MNIKCGDEIVDAAGRRFRVIQTKETSESMLKEALSGSSAKPGDATRVSLFCDVVFRREVVSDLATIRNTLSFMKNIDAFSEVTVSLNQTPGMNMTYEKTVDPCDALVGTCAAKQDLDLIAETMYGKKECLTYSTQFIIDEMRRLQTAVFPGCSYASPGGMVDQIKSLRADSSAYRTVRSNVHRLAAVISADIAQQEHFTIVSLIDEVRKLQADRESFHKLKAAIRKELPA